MERSGVDCYLDRVAFSDRDRPSTRDGEVDEHLGAERLPELRLA